MLLLFLCPGTSQVPNCWLSCQTSCCAPLHVAWQHRPASPPPLPRPLRCFVMWTPLLYHHGRVMGRDRLRQPPQGLQGSGYHTWQSATPRPTARQVPRRFRSHQAGLIFRPAGFFTCLHSSSTRTISGHHLRDWTSDLSSCRPMLELRVSPVETGYAPG
jgi:hypothetical protein